MPRGQRLNRGCTELHHQVPQSEGGGDSLPAGLSPGHGHPFLPQRVPHTTVLSKCPRRSLASKSTGGSAVAEPRLGAPRRAGGERQAVQRLLSNYQQENLRLHQAA